MLHNLKDEKWHPIAFLNMPRPSEDGTENFTRYKSKGHHTTGFKNRDEAIEFAKTTMTEWSNANFSKTLYCLDKAFPWDGEETPAMVVHFTVDENPVPVF